MSKKTGLQTVGVDAEGCPQARLTVNRYHVAALGVLGSPCGHPGPLLCGPSCLAGGRVLGLRVRRWTERPGGDTREIQHTDEVPVLEVVAVQLVARLLRIHNIFIDNEGGALGVARNTLSNLAGFTSKQGASRDEARGVDIPDGSVLSEEVEQLLWGDVVAGRRSGCCVR